MMTIGNSYNAYNNYLFKVDWKTNIISTLINNTSDKLCLLDNYIIRNKTIYDLKNISNSIKTLSNYVYDSAYGYAVGYYDNIISFHPTNHLYYIYHITEDLDLELLSSNAYVSDARFLINKTNLTAPQLNSSGLFFTTSNNTGTNVNRIIFETNAKIPVSIQVGSNILFNTINATAQSSDILEGKTAYSQDSKIVGTYVPDKHQIKELEINVNGDYNIKADEGYDVIEELRLKVNSYVGSQHNVGTNDLPSLVEGVNALPDPDYTPDEWNGISEEYLIEPTDYYKFPLDLDTIYNEDKDKDNYNCVSIFAFNAATHNGQLLSGAITGGTAWKFSDDSELKSSSTSPSHVFDDSKDIEINGDKYRYIIVYNNSSSNLTFNTSLFRPDAIILYKGNFSTFTFGDKDITPLYIEIKNKVTSISSIARTSDENYRLKTFICNATRVNFANNVFSGCRELTFIKCTSTLSAVGGAGWFNYIKNCWIYFKEFRFPQSQTTAYVNCLSHMTDCTIIVDNIYGSLPGYYCHANGGFFQYFSDFISFYDNKRCRFKIGNIEYDWLAPGTNSALEIEIESVGRNVFPGTIKWDTGSGNHGELHAIGTSSIESSKCIGIKIGNINGSISNNAFNNSNVVGEVTITGGTTASPLTIGTNAFRNNKKLKGIDMSTAKISSVGATAFYGCVELNYLNLGNYVTSIGDSFIYECRNLRSFILPPTMDIIKTKTFEGCYLNSLTTGINLLSIETKAFQGLPLENISLMDNVNSIGTYAFAEMPYLKTINIPKSLMSIPDYCFYKDYNLESVSIYNTSFNQIGTYAFAYCHNLTNLELPATYNIKENAFLQCHSLNNLNIYKDTILTTTSLKGSSALRFAPDFTFSEITNLDLTNSNYTVENILPFLYSLPELETSFIINITPTMQDVCTSYSASFWYYLSRKYIREIEDGLEYCDESAEGATLIADYISAKGYSIS